METEIVLVYKTGKAATSVAEAISPDNKETPKGLKVTTTRKGKRVVTQLKCDLSLQTFISTIDDILSCVCVAERSLNAAHGKSKLNN